MTRIIALVALLPTALAAAAAVQDAPPPMVRKLLDCRAVGDGQARLACFDTQAATVAEALQRRDLIVADQPQLRKARRSLFGLAVPSLDALMGTKSDGGTPAEEDAEINATIARVSQGAYGTWILVLDDGARWVQIDTQQLSRDPKPGMPVRIRKAAMGSFLANVDKQTAMRVHREN